MQRRGWVTTAFRCLGLSAERSGQADSGTVVGTQRSDGTSEGRGAMRLRMMRRRCEARRRTAKATDAAAYW